jgi:hypothetical protein
VAVDGPIAYFINKFVKYFMCGCTRESSCLLHSPVGRTDSGSRAACAGPSRDFYSVRAKPLFAAPPQKNRNLNENCKMGIIFKILFNIESTSQGRKQGKKFKKKSGNGRIFIPPAYAKSKHIKVNSIRSRKMDEKPDLLVPFFRFLRVFARFSHQPTIAAKNGEHLRNLRCFFS